MADQRKEWDEILGSHGCEYFKITLGGDETSVPITKRHGVKYHKTATLKDNKSKNKMMHPNLQFIIMKMKMTSSPAVLRRRANWQFNVHP
jgi:hypothetical protein